MRVGGLARDFIVCASLLWNFMFFPEGTTSQPFDDELRSLAKWVEQLYVSNGPGEYAGFPEGNRPTPFDDEERLYVKANALRN